MDILESTQRVSGIALFRSPQSQKIGESNNLNVFGRKKNEGFKQESQNPGITLMYLSYFCTCNEGDLLLYWFFLIVSFTSFVLSTRQVVLVLYPWVSISPFSCLIIVIEHSDINRNSGGKGNALLNR